MKPETFQKRFGLSDNMLKILLDGNTSQWNTNDIHGKSYNITFNKKGEPIAKKIKFAEDIIGNGHNLKIHESIIRRGNDPEKKETVISDYLQEKWGGEKIKLDLDD